MRLSSMSRLATAIALPLRMRRRRGACLLAFATGHGSDALAREYRGVMTLAKPFDFEAVRGVVMRLIGTAV